MRVPGHKKTPFSDSKQVRPGVNKKYKTQSSGSALARSIFHKADVLTGKLFPTHAPSRLFNSGICAFVLTYSGGTVEFSRHTLRRISLPY